jgi:hypothetical protein
VHEVDASEGCCYATPRWTPASTYLNGLSTKRKKICVSGYWYWLMSQKKGTHLNLKLNSFPLICKDTAKHTLTKNYKGMIANYLPQQMCYYSSWMQKRLMSYRFWKHVRTNLYMLRIWYANLIPHTAGSQQIHMTDFFSWKVLSYGIWSLNLIIWAGVLHVLIKYNVFWSTRLSRYRVAYRSYGHLRPYL